MSSSRLTGQSAGLALCLSILLFCFVTPVKTAVAYTNNDNFANAETITGNTGSLTVYNDYGTVESGEPVHAGHAVGCSVWYQWQASASGNVTFHTAGSHMDTVIGVYTGSSVSTLNEVASDDDTGYDLHGSVTFNATQNTVYYIALDAYEWTGTPGGMSLNWHLGGATPTPTPAASNRIAFSADRGATTAIYAMNGDGAGVTRLTDKLTYNFGAVWSQDGTKIAFLSYRDGQSEIYVMNADGSNQTRITTSGIGSYQPAWSPDGTKIAFRGYDSQAMSDIYVVNTDGTGLTNLSNDPCGCSYTPSWSPDGTQIMFMIEDDYTSEIHLMDADGSNQTQLTNNIEYGAVWSPDGSKIAFVSERDGAPEIYVMDADGSNQTNLTDTYNVLPYAPFNDAPVWSPDGTQLAFSSDRDGQVEIYVMDDDGANLARLTNSTGSDEPRWSADGLKIMFTTNRDGNQEVYSMNPDGSSQVNRTNHPGYDSQADWQPAP
jgi:Tol biopolymer transport system component